MPIGRFERSLMAVSITSSLEEIISFQFFQF
jgi:hypothetical protein